MILAASPAKRLLVRRGMPKRQQWVPPTPIEFEFLQFVAEQTQLEVTELVRAVSIHRARFIPEE